MRAKESSASHAAWTVVLCAMLLMPVLPSMVQPIAVTVPITQPDFRMLPAAELAPIPDAPTPVLAPSVAPNPEKVAIEKGAVHIKGAGLIFEGIGWAGATVIGYLLIVAFLLSRLIASAWRVSRLQRRALPLEIGGAGDRVYSSDLVSVPVTTGVLRPRVLLPAYWARWPAGKLAAVLAHERAHIARRDPLTHWLAYVNRCVFWFHPLAWWLERKLSATAEQACDAAAVRAIGDRQRYAEVLLDMADAVRRHGGRVAWSGVGIDGAGRLGQRIDQVLQGREPRPLSRARKTSIAFGCVAAIFVAIACRQQVPAAAPLLPNPEMTANLAQRQADQKVYDSAKAMGAQQEADLDAAWKKNPEDLEKLRTLLSFYQTNGQQALGWNEMIAARRSHLLWLIEHHPESELLTQFGGSMPQHDPTGYAKAKALWLTQTAAPNATIAALSNAAYFFQTADKPVAEQLLLRLQAMDPGGPKPQVRGNVYYPSWTERMGTLYALTILGSNDDTFGNVPRSVSSEEARSQYAQSVRTKLDETKDAALLSATGSYLVRNAGQVKVDFDHAALGRSYLQRAVQLDPASRAGVVLKNLLANDRNNRLRQVLLAKQRDLVGGEIARKIGAGERLTPDDRKALTAVEYQATAAMTEADRFAYLPWLADSAYTQAEAQQHVQYVAGATASWERSKRYAQDLVTLAPKFKGDPHYGDAIFEGNVVLALHALREGDVKTSVKYMRDARQATSLSDEFQYGNLSLEQRLVNYLLKAGERESVADFLDQAARLNAFSRKRLLQDAADVRAGRMTMSYQSVFSGQN
ncbi:MAG TPA: M56 family metallopeptidase [Vicinamibacterales bacterium]|nr:M56 family metallopeptidase [Vicinamibacterales bacterium]